MIPIQAAEHPPEVESIRSELKTWDHRLQRLGEQVRRQPASSGDLLEDQVAKLDRRRRGLEGRLERARRGELLAPHGLRARFREFMVDAHRLEVAVTK